jgi:ParB-like chromosome segregation protein Spo0J
MQKAMPRLADSVERYQQAHMTAHFKNPRTHSDSQIEQIAVSLNELGWTKPILVDDSGQLIAGHGRVLAVHRLGLTEAPVMVARDQMMNP